MVLAGMVVIGMPYPVADLILVRSPNTRGVLSYILPAAYN